MSTNLEVLEAEVLQLAPTERSRLLEKVLASLDADPAVEAYWAAEADRRQAALDSGKVTIEPLNVVMQRLRAKLA